MTISPLCPVCQNPGCCCSCFGKSPRPDCKHGQTNPDTTSPWQRAVDGLNALAAAGIPVHVEPDGHISNPCGTEHIEWDRTTERWRLIHDEDDADPVPYALTPQATSVLAQPSVDKLRGILAPSSKAGA